jgi:GT2 family glycosyltransferase
MNPKYSVIVPVYNRPEEIQELLASLTQQSVKNFEVIIVEDGSTNSCADVVDSFRDQLTIEYIVQQNAGPGPSRNTGYALAKGEYFVVFDSDCIIPTNYFSIVDQALAAHPFEAWGGPDRAHKNFTVLQRAMAYTMASVLTTGGIRGAKKAVGSFQPRSFNMGISRAVFEKTGGFKLTRLAEDIEFSIRMKKLGFRVVLVPDAFVYHKRRTTLGQFFKQVSAFGKGRVLVAQQHPGELKLTHWFPTVFTFGLLIAPFLSVMSPALAMLAAVGYGVYFVAIAVDSLRVNQHVAVALLSIPAAFIQLTGYGTGFLTQILQPKNTA